MYLKVPLNSMNFRHSDCLSRRISELSRSVQDQLQIMNENLHKQEESIKKSIKKSEKAKSAINLIPTPPTHLPLLDHSINSFSTPHHKWTLD